jgi:hypothetical protein
LSSHPRFDISNGDDRIYTTTIKAPDSPDAAIMTPRLLPESSVLRPRDSSANSDDWPVFELSHVDVLDHNVNPPTQASLLHASASYPLTVIGRLRPIFKGLADVFLLPPSRRTLTIEITDVRIFSYGAYADGSIGLWAGGKAGWFQINPSPAYRQLYKDMTEAVNLLYFIADSYSNPRMSGKGKKATPLPDYTAQELFGKYASEAMEAEASASDAAEKVYQHRDFLLASMVAGKEGMMWGKNPLYVHLRKKFPQDWEKIRQRLAAPPPQAEKEASQHARQPSIDSASTSSSLKRKRGRPPKNRPDDVVSIGSSSVSGSVGKDEPSESKLAQPTKPQPPPAPSTRTSGRRKGTSQPDSQPDTPVVHQPQPEESNEDSDTDSALQPRRGKSALRLKPNKPSKGPPRSSQPAITEDYIEHDEPVPRSSPAPSGKRRRDSPSSKPRDVDEGISMPTSPSSTSDQIDSQLQSADDDAITGASAIEVQTQLALRHHDSDPVQEDTWVCALAGCTHKVYAASRPESQALIRQHYTLHACDDDERVQLVKRLQAPSMPVGHLIERVRMQAKVEGFPGSRVAGTRFPEPLKQKF